MRDWAALCEQAAYAYLPDEYAAVRLAPQLADALLEIVGLPWDTHDCGYADCSSRGVPVCPCCEAYDDGDYHEAGCAWLISARALGIA